MEMSLESLQRLGEGREAEVFAWPEGRVLRLLRDAATSAGIERERAAMRAASKGGVHVPQVFGQLEFDGRWGLVMERLRGPDLLTALARKPWLVARVGHLTGRLHARINSTPAPPELPPALSTCRAAIASLEPRLGPLAGGVWRAFEHLPDGRALCHGDFHPGQVMISGEGHMVIDWSGALRGDPFADHARTLILLDLGALPPGTKPAARAAAAVVRRLLARAYRSAYRQALGLAFDGARLEAWRTVLLACRLADEIPGEERRIMAALRRAPAAGGTPPRRR